MGGFPGLAAHFPNYEGARAIITMEISRIADSCGFAVPQMRFEGERKQLTAWASKQGPDGLKRYRSEKNERGIDGLPGLKTAN